MGTELKKHSPWRSKISLTVNVTLNCIHFVWGLSKFNKATFTLSVLKWSYHRVTNRSLWNLAWFFQYCVSQDPRGWWWGHLTWNYRMWKADSWITSLLLQFSIWRWSASYRRQRVDEWSYAKLVVWMASEDTVSHAGSVRQSSVLSPLPETAQRTWDLQMWWHLCIDELEKALGNWFRDLGSALIGPLRSQIWMQRYHQVTLHEGLSFLEFTRSQIE